MKIQSTYIFIEGLRFHAYHGVLPQERVIGNDYEVSLRVQFPIDTAMLSDDVEETLNYAEVFKLVQQEMQVPSNLLERVAYRIADRLFRKYPKIQVIDLKLMKLNPPMGAECHGAGVELHLINDKTV